MGTVNPWSRLRARRHDSRRRQPGRFRRFFFNKAFWKGLLDGLTG